MRQRALLPALALAAALGAPAAAHAGWDAPELLSAAGGIQYPDASSAPAISGDGRYAVFATLSHDAAPQVEPPGSYRQGGIVRRDLRTGATEGVAGGPLYAGDVPLGTKTYNGAATPAISAAGRYVAFATDEPLVAADANGRSDVYVRDMQRPATATDAYTLVSALDGGDAPATYDAAAGTALSTAQAISADGRTVAFWTTGGSDLPSGAHTDGGQILVRELDTHRTLLVSAAADGTPAGNLDGGPLSATLAPDASTVAWAAPVTSAALMVPMLGSETSHDANNTVALVRDLQGGAVRRPLSLTDYDDPACPPGGEASLPGWPDPPTGPCDGPVAGGKDADAGTGVQSVSLTGAAAHRLLVTTVGGPRGVLPNAGASDLAWLDLAPGLSRKTAYQEITREGTDASKSAAIVAATLSPNGRYAALTTARTRFDGALRLAGAGSPTINTNIVDVYVADFQAGTVTLVSGGVAGAKGIDSSFAPAVADDGTVVFASAAANLVAGDGNSALDVFTARVHVTPPGGALVDALAPAAFPAPLTPARTLRVTARALASGKVVLTVVAPGAGGLRVRVAAHGDRRVALKTGAARGTGATTLTVTPKLADRRRIRAKAGLRVTLSGTFRDTAGTLTRKATATLSYKKPKATKKAAKR